MAKVSSTNYSFFDQFKDVTINLSPYFKYIKQFNDFDYTFSDKQNVSVKLTNIFEKTDIVNNFSNNIDIFNVYRINEYETPDMVANNVYGDKDYWWIICMFNNVKNVFNDWLLTEEQLIAIANYLFTTEQIYTEQTYYDLLFEQNETRRSVLVLKEIYLNDMITQFRSAVESK